MPYTLHLRRRICHFPLSALLPSRCHHTYSQIQGNTSRPRGISTIGKGSYYRASGFPKDTRPKDVFEVIQQQLLDHERQIHPEISVVPGCDHSSSSSTVAILKFTAQRPQFLLTLDEKPLSDVHIQFDSAQSRRGHITFDRHFHGFTQLYPTEEKHAITADVIAITGMDGHAYGSWMSRAGDGSMWLRDFLSKDLPNCRTMIYGYHSKLLHPNVNQLKEYGRQFLSEIEKIRNTTELQCRPLIFICHSYGGIVLSHSLVQARLPDMAENYARGSIYKSTYGMLFFGTPHRGSPKDDVLKMVEQTFPNRVPALLETDPNNQDLKTQLDYFAKIIGDRQIGSFYETEPTPTPVQGKDGKWTRAGEAVLKVTEPSATLQFPGFRERKIPVNANHTNMVKFGSSTDPTYTTVVKMLREFTRDAPKVVSKRFAPSRQFASAVITVPFTRTTGFFFGRSDVLARLEQIFDSEKYHRRAAVTGLGGIGKSSIAIEFSKRYARRYPERNIFWVKAASLATFNESYRENANALKLAGSDDKKVDILRLLRDYLSDPLNGHWLMILDNADDRTLFSIHHARQNENDSAELPLQPLSSILPQGSHGSILITTRDREVAEDLTGNVSSIIPVYPLDEPDSIKLLRAQSGDALSPKEDAVELVDMLDNIPLAINHAAAFISDSAPRMTITRYLSMYRRRLPDRHPEITVPNAVLSTWQISFDTLLKHYPNSSKLLSLMSLLHNDDIPDFLLFEGLPKYENDRALFEKDIAPLVRFSLIILDGESFDMHRLVQLSTRAWLSSHQELHQRVREAHSLVSEAFPDISSGFENWGKCIALLPHAEAAIGLDSGPMDVRQLEQKGKLLYNMAYYEYQKGEHAAALTHSMAAKSIFSEMLNEGDKRLVLKARTLVLRLFSEMGQSERAIEEVKSRLARIRKRGDVDPNEFFALWEEWSRALLDDGKLEESEKQAKMALRSIMTKDGISEVHKLDAKRTLARALNFQGEPEQAEELLRQVLERRQQLWSLNHVDTLKSEADLAECLANQGRYEEAWPHFETAATRMKRFIGEDDARYQKIMKTWEDARNTSKEIGWPRLKRHMQGTWRRLRLKIFGHKRAVLTPVSPHKESPGLWRIILLVSMLLIFLPLFVYSLFKREEVLHFKERFDDWTKRERHMNSKMELNEALDREQDEKIRRLEEEIQKLRKEHQERG